MKIRVFKVKNVMKSNCEVKNHHFCVCISNQYIHLYMFESFHLFIQPLTSDDGNDENKRRKKKKKV